jgi:YfiR/HmsC-like
MAKHNLVSLLGICLFLSLQQKPMAQSLEEQTVLAALALNIVRFTTWPNEAKIGKTIDLCVVGDNVVQQSFSSIDNKAVGDKTLRIVNLTRLRNFEQCHGLYVSQLNKNVLLQLFEEVKKKPLLTIGETADFAQQGGMIGMENADGKINLYVNLTSAKESNLNISARLLKLAKIIGG